MDGAMARGLKVLALFHSVPAWVRDAGGLADSSNRAAFAAFTRVVVARYKDRITHWETWNEPNLTGFWGGLASEYYTTCREEEWMPGPFRPVSMYGCTAAVAVRL